MREAFSRTITLQQPREHRYHTSVQWTGNRGTGTDEYGNYGREHVIRIDGKPNINGSSDPSLRGDATKHNPEEMLVAALSACHMMTYLRMATEAGVVVTAYTDTAVGTVVENTNGHFGGHFREVTLYPTVTIAAASDPEKAVAAHEAARRACFITNSVNFQVRCEPHVTQESS
ncbi:MAG: OsmC family protein [Gammaproteobacteria bacterium]